MSQVKIFDACIYIRFFQMSQTFCHFLHWTSSNQLINLSCATLFLCTSFEFWSYRISGTFQRQPWTWFSMRSFHFVSLPLTLSGKSWSQYNDNDAHLPMAIHPRSRWPLCPDSANYFSFPQKFGWNYEQKRQTKAEATCKFYIIKPSMILQAGHKFFIILTQNFYDWKSESAIIMYVHDLYLVVGKTTTMKGIWWEVSSVLTFIFLPQILIQYNVLKRSVFHHLPWSGVSRGVFWYCGMFENTRVVF